MRFAFAPNFTGRIMSQPDERFTPNTLLGALSADDLELLKPHLTRVHIAVSSC